MSFKIAVSTSVGEGLGKGSVNSNGSLLEDGEQLLHGGVLFRPQVAGGSHGRPPAECLLSAAPCYVPIPPSRPSTRSLRGEEKSRESCREEREDKNEARARVRGRLARRRPLWLRWQVIPAHTHSFLGKETQTIGQRKGVLRRV